MYVCIYIYTHTHAKNLAPVINNFLRKMVSNGLSDNHQSLFTEQENFPTSKDYQTMPYVALKKILEKSQWIPSWLKNGNTFDTYQYLYSATRTEGRNEKNCFLNCSCFLNEQDKCANLLVYLSLHCLKKLSTLSELFN